MEAKNLGRLGEASGGQPAFASTNDRASMNPPGPDRMIQRYVSIGGTNWMRKEGINGDPSRREGASASVEP